MSKEETSRPSRSDELPYRVVEHVWIPMSDGSRLSAQLWLPVRAEHESVPAILEFIPYRKRDGVALRDHANHGTSAALFPSTVSRPPVLVRGAPIMQISFKEI